MSNYLGVEAVDGGQAFPLIEWKPPPMVDYKVSPGMTLRDWFAGQALIGIGTATVTPAKAPYYHNPSLDDDKVLHDRAIWAYRQADAMIKARKQT